MKQIITVLAILISGIAFAQSELYTASICGGGTNNPRHVDLNGLDYILVEGYRAEIEAEFNGNDVIVCLSSHGNVNRNWRSYWENYVGATITRQPFNWDLIEWTHNGRQVSVQRRTQNPAGLGYRYNINRSWGGKESSYYARSENYNALEMYQWAINN